RARPGRPGPGAAPGAPGGGDRPGRGTGAGDGAVQRVPDRRRLRARGVRGRRQRAPGADAPARLPGQPRAGPAAAAPRARGDPSRAPLRPRRGGGRAGARGRDRGRRRGRAPGPRASGRPDPAGRPVRRHREPPAAPGAGAGQSALPRPGRDRGRDPRHAAGGPALGGAVAADGRNALGLPAAPGRHGPGAGRPAALRPAPAQPPPRRPPPPMAFDAFALMLAMLAMGVLLARLRALPANAADTLNLVVLYVCLPAAILVNVPRLRLEPSLLALAALPWIVGGLA